ANTMMVGSGKVRARSARDAPPRPVEVGRGCLVTGMRGPDARAGRVRGRGRPVPRAGLPRPGVPEGVPDFAGRLGLATGGPASDVLRPAIGQLALARHRARRRPGPGAWLQWREGTTQLLRWLLAGRPDGPVFLTGRRAPAGSAPADTCPVTGRARMSYRRA